MYSNGPNMPLAQRLTMLNRSYNQDMAPPTVVGQGQGQQKEAAAAIRSSDEASNQENFAQGSAGDFTQNKTDEQKFYKFATHDNKHRDRDRDTSDTMGSGGDEPHAAGLKQHQQQYTVGCTTPLKGILVRSGTQNPHPLTKLTNAAANAPQSSGPLKQHPAAALASVLSKSQGTHGKGSSVLAAFNQNQQTPDAGGPKQQTAVQNSFPLKKLPQAALTSVLSKSQDADKEEESAALAAAPLRKMPDASTAILSKCCAAESSPPAVDFRNSQGADGDGSSVVCASQSAAGLLKKMPDARTSVLTRTGCSAGTKGQLSTPADDDSPLEAVISSSPVAAESPDGATRAQLIPTIALKKRSIETVKLPVQRDAVDRPRVPPQDDWNVHVKFTSKRNRGRKSSPKEHAPKTAAKKNRTKVTAQPPNLTQSAPWNVVAGGSWNTSPAAAEAAPPKQERPPMASAKTAAPSTQPEKIRSEDARAAPVARVPATITATVPGVATSWNLVARKSCHKALATEEESKSQQPAGKASGEASPMAQPWPAAKDEPQKSPVSPVRESSSVALEIDSAPPRSSWNLIESPAWNGAIAEVQRRRSIDPCSSSSSCCSSSRDSRVNSMGRNSRGAISGSQSPELQCPQVKPVHTAPMPKTLVQMKFPVPVPVPVLKRSNNSASIHSQIEALALDSECSDQEGNGRDSGSEYGSEETEEEQLEQQEQQEQLEGEEAEEEEEEGDESEESVPQHPLNNEWTMWYLEPDRAKTWEQTLHQITSFKTVENFWSLYYHIKTPSQIKIGSDYCMFKAGVRPMWEDEANVKGGRWIVSFPKSATGDLNFYWEYSLLSLIGEFCEHSPDLCGAVVNIRQKADKIALWTADGSNEEGILEIGRQLRDGLPPGAGYALQYQLHSDSMVQQGSVVRSIYTL